MSNQQNSIDEGYIKFRCEWADEPLSVDVPAELIECRDEMYRYQLIGYYPQHKVGYGNISIRTEKGILVSGTQTGDIYPIQPEHFTLVTAYNIKKNKVECHGPIKASSESMTHAAVYEADPSAQAIIHVHHLGLWKELKDKVPTTGEDVPYGTPEMAEEIFRLFRETDVKEKKVIVMAGHEEGIIFFGSSLEEAKTLTVHTARPFL